jgi:sensor histidine kinase YesM
MNALLNSRASYCQKYNIEFDYQITANLSVFSEIDLSVLIGNLLDNAIDAAKECKSPCVKIRIWENKAYLAILVSNSVISSVLESNPDLLTMKSDKDNHGFGLKTVKDVVEKYDGIFDAFEENHMFSVDVRLKCSGTTGK